MVARKVSLQHKVLLGYMILIMAVCGMVSILLYERSRMREIKTEHRRYAGYAMTSVRRIAISRSLPPMESPSLSGRIPIFVSIAENACKRTACYKY